MFQQIVVDETKVENSNSVFKRVKRRMMMS